MARAPRGATKGAIKGIAKAIDLDVIIREADDILAKPITRGGTSAASRSTRHATESAVERAARRTARKLSKGRTASATGWGDRARQLYGDHPSWMQQAHGHHVVFKQGSKATREYVDQSKKILEHFDIDWLHGKENLIWAPNRGHTVANAREVLSRLTDAARSGGGRQAVEEALAKAGREVFDGWP